MGDTASDTTQYQVPGGGERHPFVIERLRLEETPAGYFQPGVRVLLTETLRTSGLWRALPPGEVKDLLLLLTFVTANGWCHPSLPELSAAMGVSDVVARARMQRLMNFGWQGRPMVTELKRASGLDAYLPSPLVVAVREALPVPDTPDQSEIRKAAGREAVYAHTRATYARPRAEVERVIAEQMGWKEEGDGPEAVVRRRLSAVGIPREEADLILSHHPLERIERQLSWLPYRKAKSPARFLVAAIENDYEEPPVLRLKRAIPESTGAAGEGLPAGPGDSGGVDTPGEELPPLSGSV